MDPIAIRDKRGFRLYDEAVSWSWFKLTYAEWALFILLGSWLVYSGSVVNIEYYDGWDAIINTKSLLSDGQGYVLNRAPFMSFYLMPAYYLHRLLELAPENIRPYKLSMVVAHLAYLIGVYYLMCSYYGRRWSVLLAYIAAVPTFMFFSYGAFISHDIFPGLIYLFMVIRTASYIESRKKNLLVQLVVAGAVVALIKHVYGIIWFSILISYAVVLYWDRIESAWLLWGRLLLAAVVSGVMVWLVICWSLRAYDTAFQGHWLWYPYEQISFLLTKGSGAREFPYWVYLRNLPAFGIATIILLPMAMKMALKQGMAVRSATLNIVMVFLFMHLLSSKEVRYLIFLSPLMAFVLVGAMDWFLDSYKRQAILWPLMLFSVLPVHAYSPLNEAGHILRPFFQANPYEHVLSGLSINEERKPAILLSMYMMGFAESSGFYLAGDPYHRVFHMARHQLQHVLNERGFKVATAPRMDLESIHGWDDDFRLVWENRVNFARPKSWYLMPMPEADGQNQAVFRPGSLRVFLRHQGNISADSEKITGAIRINNDGAVEVRLGQAGNPISDARIVRLSYKGQVYRVRKDNDVYVVDGLSDTEGLLAQEYVDLNYLYSVKDL